MRFYSVHQPNIDILALDRDRILRQAHAALDAAPFHITDVRAPLSAGGPHDFYSNGDYWWPNPETPDGLPYVRRDGETNPDAFWDHRLMIRRLRTMVSALAAAYRIENDDVYVAKAAQLLHGFFLDADTRMYPSLPYAQAIPGICSGRGIGIIDTLHLVEIPVAVEALAQSPACAPDLLDGLKAWFAAYLDWLTTHPYGLDEMQTANNHGTAWTVQVAMFAHFTGNQERLRWCRERYTTDLLPNQMAADGSFPLELERTKPYSYSIFNLELMAILSHILSTSDENLWEFTLGDGRGIRHGVEFLYPYLLDKSRWPYPRDVQHFENWPVRLAALLFAGCVYGEERYLNLWKDLEPDPQDAEVRRNLVVFQPLLWIS